MKTVLALIISLWPCSDDKQKQTVIDLQDQAKFYFNTDLDTAAWFADEAYALANDINYLPGQARGQFVRAIIAKAKGDAREAISLFLDALYIYSIVDDPKYASNQAKIYTTLGKLCRQHNRYQEAIDYYNRGIKLARLADDRETWFKLLQNTAVAYRWAGEYKIALDLLKQKMALHEIAIDNEKLRTFNNNERLRTFNTIGGIYYLQQKYDSAEVWFNKILAADSHPSFRHFRVQAYHNLANVHKDEKNYEMAWSYFELALEANKSLGNAKNSFITYQDMAELALMENDPELALTFAQKATPLMEKLPEIREYYDHYQLLARCVQHQNPELALAYHEQYIEIDKKFDLQQQELTAQAEAYKVDLILASHEKRLSDQAQKQKQIATIIYMGLGALLSCLLIYAYMERKKRQLYANNPWFRMISSATETRLYLDDDEI